MPAAVSTIFTIGDNLCDFLVASLDGIALQNKSFLKANFPLVSLNTVLFTINYVHVGDRAWVVRLYGEIIPEL